MTELFERRLSERLHAHPLPPAIPDVAHRSVRRGKQIRRRRIGVVAAVIALLLIPGAASQWLNTLNSDTPPVVTPTVTSSAPPGPQSLILDPVGRLEGAPPEVATKRGGTVWLPRGDQIELPSSQFGTVTEVGDGAAWLTREQGTIVLNPAGQPLPLATDGKEISGTQAGPGGSVMIRTNKGPILWTAAQGMVTPTEPLLGTKGVVATANALWVEEGGRVWRVDVADLSAPSYAKTAHPWKKVIVGDPRADRVVVVDDRDCQAVLDGSTGVVVSRSCAWELAAFSADGRMAVGYNVKYATIDIVDLDSSQAVMAIDAENNPVGPVFVFDQANRLNLRVGSPELNFGLMIVDTSGGCWISAMGYGDTMDYVLPNRR